MTGYSRTRTFTNNETINADDFTTEFDNLTAAFNGVSGHDHSGGTTGKPISMVGNTDGFTKITANEGTNELRFYTNVSEAAALQFSIKDGVIEPNADSDLDIGTTAKRFKDLYVDSATVTGTVTADSLAVQTSSGNAVASVTSTTGKTAFQVVSTFDGEVANQEASIEIGAKNLAHIDLKTPDTDDYDLRIQHSESANLSMINSLTDDLFLRSGAKVALQHSGANTKLETTDTGISVTGTVAASDGLTADYIDLTGGKSTTTTGAICADQIRFSAEGTDEAKIYASVDGVNTSLFIQSNDDSGDKVRVVAGGTESLTVSDTGIDVTGTVTADLLTLHPTNAASEGGQIEFQRAVDNQTAWYVDVYGAGTDTSLRFVDNDDTNNPVTRVSMNNTGIDVTGNITVSGNVEGRDIAADGLILDAIEAGADVTDTENVVAALTAGTNISIAANGTISSTDTNTTYSTATSSTAGLVKIGYVENDKNYPVELSSDKMYVNVPWEDSQTAGTGLSLSGGAFSVNASQTQITSVGALDGGSITANFGAINIGSNTISTTGTINAGTVEFPSSSSDSCSITTTVTESATHLDFKLRDDDADSFRFRFDHYEDGVLDYVNAARIKPDPDIAGSAKYILDVTGKVVAEGFNGTGSVIITNFIDDDTFATATAANVPTAESVKAYVDAQAAAASDGDITSVVAGSGLTGGAVSGDATLNVGAGTGITVNTADIAINLNDLTTSTASADGDFFVVVDDAGAQKKLTKGNIDLSGLNNDANWTSNSGTVTSVGVGTGLDVSNPYTTPSISLDLSELTDMTADVTGTTEVILNDGGTNSRKAISEIKLSQFNNDSNFSTTVGTVTEVTVGTGLDVANGTTEPFITLDLYEIAASVTNADAAHFLVTDSSGDAHRIARGNVNLSGFNDDLVYTNNAGTVTSVSVGTGLDVVNGTTTPSISLDLSELTSSTTSADAFDLIALKEDGTLQKVRRENITLAGFDGTIPQGTVTGVTATAPVVSSGGDAPIISMVAATTEVDGYMTATQAEKLAGIAEGATAGGGISGVTVNTGLDVVNGTTAPDISLNLSELETSTTNADGAFFVVTDSSNDQHKITKGNIDISGFNNDSGFTSNAGTVTSVTGGTGVDSSGGTTPELSLNLNELVTDTGTVTAFAAIVGTASKKVAPSDIPLTAFSNDSGFTSNAGTVTSVSATLPLEVSNGSTTPALSISAATDENDGYMTSAQAAKLEGIAEGATVGSTGPDSITAGNGLTGGGDSGTVSLAVGAGDGIAVTATTVKVDDSVLRTTGTQSIAGDKTFTDPVVISTDTNDSGSTLTIQDTEQGASQRPVIKLDRQSASPAVGDEIGAIEFHGRREGPASVQYAEIKAEINNKEANTAEGQLVFSVSDYTNHAAGGFKEVLIINEDGATVVGNVVADSFQGQMKTELSADTSFSVTETIAKRNSRIVYTNNSSDSVFNLPTIFTYVNSTSVPASTTWTLINYSDQRIKIQAPVGYTLSRLVGGSKLDTSAGGFSYLNAYGACEIMAQGLGSSNFLVYGSELT